jgi:hypothetical protein
MARFVTGNNLNYELERLMDTAKETIILISPYLKLHERYASSLRSKKDDPNLEIIVVFGKNEHDMSKSMQIVDFNFFKEFPNIEIRFEKRLHAKYYANEVYSILTSMNLYSYSQDNNIEAGVVTKSNFVSNLANNVISNVTGAEDLDTQSWNYFQRVVEQSELLFKRKPRFEKVLLGLSQKYTESTIEIDKLSDFFAEKMEKAFVSKSVQKKELGYCIRTGKRIPFNPKMPMCDEAFVSWSRFQNKEYQEKYCHFSGEASNGETSFAKPILPRNYNKAKTALDF